MIEDGQTDYAQVFENVVADQGLRPDAKYTPPKDDDLDLDAMFAQYFPETQSGTQSESEDPDREEFHRIMDNAPHPTNETEAQYVDRLRTFLQDVGINGYEENGKKVPVSDGVRRFIKFSLDTLASHQHAVFLNSKDRSRAQVDARVMSEEQRKADWEKQWETFVSNLNLPPNISALARTPDGKKELRRIEQRLRAQGKTVTSTAVETEFWNWARSGINVQ